MAARTDAATELHFLPPPFYCLFTVSMFPTVVWFDPSGPQKLQALMYNVENRQGFMLFCVKTRKLKNHHTCTNLQSKGQHDVRLGQDVSLVSDVQEGVVHGGALELLLEVRTSFGHRQTLQVRHEQVDG